MATFPLYADNYGPFPYLLAFRMYAVMLPDLSRDVCRNQSSDVRARLESSLASSGLEQLTVADLCAGNFCEGKTVEELRLNVTFEGYRRDRMKDYARHSPAEQEKDCKTFLSMVEKLSGSKNSPPEAIFERYINAISKTP